MDLTLKLTTTPKVEEFHDAIGIDVVISGTGIAICGIFVWGQRNADLHIYATSLLRVNAKQYITVIQLAAELADMLYANDARTMEAVKNVLNAAAKTATKFNLQVS